MTSFTIDTIVAEYVKNRDLMKQMNDEHDERIAPYVKKKEVMEAWLLNQLNETRADSVKTEHGTVYKSTVMSATVDNWDLVLRHMLSSAIDRVLTAIEEGRNVSPIDVFLETPELSLLNHAVNKTAVKEALERGEDPTTYGVKIAHVTNVGVRRA